MFRTSFILVVLQCIYLIERTNSHGYLVDPPARSSAWLFDKDFTKCCRYYNHAEMSCGGTYHQWVVNGGKCSICGEAYDLKPKFLGLGDAMYLGKIVRTYTQGATIPVTVILTANHLGEFQFRVCSLDNDPITDATQSCLDLNVLTIDNSSTEYNISRLDATVQLNVTLPPDLVCKHCVFQWKYITGNSWGVSHGRACLGCGKQNEEFFGCSDIAIISEVESILNSTVENNSTTVVSQTNTTTTTRTTTTTIAPRKCSLAATFSQSFDISSIMKQYCELICPNNCASDDFPGNELLHTNCVDTCNKLCSCQ